jgi:uncharacterized protein (TIGR00269 family)
MGCVRCGKEAVIELQQGGLCEEHFVRYFQRKVYRTIRKHKLFSKQDRLCVACSGGKDSLTILDLVGKLARKRRQPIVALGIDEGVPGYREKQLEDMKYFCDKNDIEYRIVTFREEFGYTIEELMKIASKKKLQISQCALCGVLRRRLLNQCAKRLGATRIIVGHNLDDEVQTFMMNLFKGGIELAARMGPATGMVKHEGFIPRVKPLYFCTELETTAYTKLNGIRVIYASCPYRKDSYRAFIAKHIDEIEKDYNGTKTSIIGNLMKMLPLLKKQYSSGKIPECRLCGEPSRNDVCTACATLKKLGIKGPD